MKPARMNFETELALLQSVAHWERMATGKARLGEKPAGEQCALCEKFCWWTSQNRECLGCPVMERTGRPHCRSTPFARAHWEFYWLPESFPASAKKEVDFLKSLLPTGRRKPAELKAFVAGLVPGKPVEVPDLRLRNSLYRVAARLGITDDPMAGSVTYFEIGRAHV